MTNLKAVEDLHLWALSLVDQVVYQSFPIPFALHHNLVSAISASNLRSFVVLVPFRIVTYREEVSLSLSIRLGHQHESI